MNKRASISAGLRADATGWTRGLNQAHAATQRFASNTASAMKGAQKGSTNAGMGMLMLSQGIDDIQYGFKGIVNNIAPMAMALGAGSGLAGALTMLAVAFNQAGGAAEKAWDKISGNDAVKDAKKASAVMEEMHANRLKRIAQEAAMGADYQAKLAVDVEAANDRFRKNHETEIQAKQELIELEAKLQAARISALDPIKKASALSDIENKAGNQKLALEEQMYKERLARGYTADAAEKRAQKLIAEKQKLELEPYLGPKGKARLGELPRLIDSANTEAGAETARRREDTAGLKDVKNRQANLAKEKDIADAESLTEKKDKAIKDTIDAVVKSMEKAQERIKAVDAQEERAAVKAMQNARTKASMDNDSASRMARHMGKNRKADKMDDAAKVEQLVNEGLPRTDAESLVNRDRNQAEDEALGPRRRKLRNLPKGVTSRVEIPGPVMPLPIRPGKGKGVDPDPVEKKGMESEAAIKVLSRIEENTRKTAAEQQQPAKRS